MLKYYVLNKTPESEAIYFNNEGIFNFWNEYLMIRINGKNLVAANRTGRKFSGEMTNAEYTACVQRLYQEFCDGKGCNWGDGSQLCEIAKEWGDAICRLVRVLMENVEPTNE